MSQKMDLNLETRTSPGSQLVCDEMPKIGPVVNKPIRF